MRNLINGIVWAALVTSLSSCGFGTMMTQTAGMEPVGNGVDTTLGELKVQDVTVVTNGAGVASLVASVVNPTLDADALVAVQINGVDATLTPLDMTVPARRSLQIGYSQTAHVDVALDLTAGTYVDITFLFANAGQLDVSVLVVEATDAYAAVTPAPGFGNDGSGGSAPAPSASVSEEMAP